MREDEAVRRGFIQLELAARYQEALAAADEIRAFEAEIHRLKGELLLRRDDSAVAEARCLQRAIECGNEISGPSCSAAERARENRPSRPSSVKGSERTPPCTEVSSARSAVGGAPGLKAS